MARLASTFLGGLGLTLASTFASALNLSHGQQVAGFVAGIGLMLLAGVLYAASVVRRRKQGTHGGKAEDRATSTVVRARGGKDFRLRRNVGINTDSAADLEDVEGVDAEGNVVIHDEDDEDAER
jgi:hypothetical protein